jgi:hypothetical protein
VIIYILQFIGELFVLAGKLFDFLNQRQLVDLAKTSQQLETLKAQVDAAHQAVLIREATRLSDERNGLPIDDEFDRDRNK